MKNKYIKMTCISERKTPVFGMLKRGEKVYTQIVKRCSVNELMSIIKGHADTSAVVYSDGFRAYDGLVNYGYKRHYRVRNEEDGFADGRNHINGIENFWGLCKVRLAKSCGFESCFSGSSNGEECVPSSAWFPLISATEIYKFPER